MMQFKSEISYALLSIILVIFGSIIGLGIIERDIILLMITGLSFCLPLSVFLRTYYKIQGDTLLVVSGMLYRKEFSISEIKKIEATNSWISSPALSMNRIELFFNRFDSVIISPKNQQLFIEMLLTRNPSIVVLVNRSNA